MSRSAQEELKELESRGRRAVQQQQESQDRAREAAKQEQRLEASRQLQRYVGTYRTRALPPSILWMVWAAASSFLWHLGAEIPLALLLGLFAGGLAYMVPTWRLGSVAAERRWLKALPFGLNYFEMLSVWNGSPVVFEIAFAGEEPSTDSLRALFALTDAGVEITGGHGTLLAKFPAPTTGGSTGIGEDEPVRPDGPGVVVLVHKVAKTLRLLHSEHAIDHVNVRSGKKS